MKSGANMKWKRSWSNYKEQVVSVIKLFVWWHWHGITYYDVLFYDNAFHSKMYFIKPSEWNNRLEAIDFQQQMNRQVIHMIAIFADDVRLLPFCLDNTPLDLCITMYFYPQGTIFPVKITINTRFTGVTYLSLWAPGPLMGGWK